jgi:L-cysteine/cystine lyase
MLEAMNIYNEARQRVAHLLHADTGEIVLTANTTAGLNIVSHGINWQAGDEVITTNHEHIGVYAPLYQIRDRLGVVMRIIDLGDYATVPLYETIQQHISERTKLIVLSHVTWTTGTILDIQAVARLGKEREIPVLIDGAQSVGNIAVDVQALGVDFYAIPMQKWLCGPDGTGALYIRQDSQHYISPIYVGYTSTSHEPGVEWELLPNAQQFEFGGRQTVAIAGQAAALQWVDEYVGHDWQYAHIAEINAYTYQALSTLPDITIWTPQPGVNGLLSFTIAGTDDAAIVQTLRDDYNIYVRSIPSTRTLRISTGFYNTEEDIDKLVHALKAIVKKEG